MTTTAFDASGLFVFFFLCFSSLFVLNISGQNNSGCGLDFTAFPYQPTGECIVAQKRIDIWGGFPTTTCCQNALTVLSQALASQAAKNPNGSLFIPKQQWDNCSSSMMQNLPEPARSCGFDELSNGSCPCSDFSLSAIQQMDAHKDALKECAQLNTSFNDHCGSCINAILGAGSSMIEKYSAESSKNERAICFVAIVVSVAASVFDNHALVNAFFRCLRGLDVLDPGYIKLNSSVANALMAIVLATIGMMLAIMLIKYVTKNKKQSSKPPQTKQMTNWSGLYRFSKAEIEKAINFGNEKICLGRGSAGQVFKGVLPSGQVVAIKRIYRSNTSDSFTREVEGLSRYRHPNLVSLFGCCVEKGEQFLVYEYCSAGNLAQRLLRKDRVLTWETRVKILRDCALALKYLHNHMDGCLVHRDIKLTNILLTENLEPKLSDFGLAKMLKMEESKVFTEVRGTIGYMDPEYMSNAKLTCASDIYSFGIVALQILSGQKVIELDLDARDQLTRKAKDVSLGKRPLKDFEDPRLKGHVNSDDFESILKIAVLCAAKSSNGRPNIEVVFQEMDRAWKNTFDKKAKREMMVISSSSTNSRSKSWDVVPAV